MKTFKRYLKENTEPVQGQLDSMGRPCVLIQHGKHSQINEALDPINSVGKWISVNDNAHLGYSPHAVGAKLHEHQGELHPEEGNPRHEAIARYTNFSRNLNKKLMHHHAMDEPAPERVADHTVAHMDSATNHHSLKAPLHVYSGTGFDVGAMSAKHAEGHIHLPAFTSTSIDKDIAHHFARPVPDEFDEDKFHRHVLHIHLPEGHKGVFVGETKHTGRQFSDVPTEHEFILPRNTTLKVHPESDTIKHSDTHMTHIWHATPVEHK